MYKTVKVLRNNLLASYLTSIPGFSKVGTDLLVKPICKNSGFNIHGLNNRRTIRAKLDPCTMKLRTEKIFDLNAFLSV